MNRLPKTHTIRLYSRTVYAQRYYMKTRTMKAWILRIIILMIGLTIFSVLPMNGRLVDRVISSL